MTLGFIDSKQPDIFSVAPRTNLAIGFINPLPFAFNVAIIMWAEKIGTSHIFHKKKIHPFATYQ